jgi:hypothetical protein
MSFQFFRSSKGSSPSLHIPKLGLELQTRLASEISGKALAVIETLNAPGFGPPLQPRRSSVSVVRSSLVKFRRNT